MLMLSWNEIVQRYITRYSNQIQQATKPLRDHFGLGYFTYHHIDYAGKYTVLVDRPDYAEYYVGKQIYLSDPYLRKADNYKPGLCLFEQFGSEEYKSTVMKAAKNVLDVDIGVMLIKKDETGVEFFGFSGKKGKSALEGLYLNEPELLASFGDHFKEALKPILVNMQGEANTLLELKGEDYSTDHPVHPGVIPACRLKYLSSVGKGCEVQLAAKLSKRERDCLRQQLLGKSSKETAALLGLSGRTVEFYFENIKDKFGCWTKSEIFQIAKTLDSLGLL